MDAKERAMLLVREEGASVACTQSARAMSLALDLHAVHGFTDAAAVDGSVWEGDVGGRRVARRVGYGVWEGIRDARGAGGGLWGEGLPPDMEVTDAESYAIYAYLRRVVERGGGKQSRVLILSDCLGGVTTLEVA